MRQSISSIRPAVLTLSLVLALLAGCTKDQSVSSIINSYPPNAIVGRVLAKHMPVTVTAWQEVKRNEVITDDSGYYAIDGIAVGTYRIDMVSADNKTMTMPNVIVESGKTVNLDLRYIDICDFTLTAPYVDLKAVAPGFADMICRLDFTTDMDTMTMKEAITISPAVAFRVGAYYWSPTAAIGVIIIGDLHPCTDYTIRVDTTFKSLTGASLVDAREIHFRTDSVRLTSLTYSSQYSSTTATDSIIPAGWVPQMVLNFNAPIDIDSVNKAFSMSPNMAGYWIQSNTQYHESRLRASYFATDLSGAVPDQVYTLTLNGSVPLFEGYALGETFVKRLVTTPVMATTVYPELGSRVSNWSGSIQIRFNCPMDTQSVRSGFSLETWGGTPMGFSTAWTNNRQTVNFYPTNLVVGLVYKFAVETSAHSIDGRNLKERVYSYFQYY